MERTLLTDDDWATIDGRLCLVATFVPMAKVQGDSVIAMSATMPYGSVHIKCEELLDDITGFITHKTDFAMLWTAFNARTQVAGASFLSFRQQCMHDCSRKIMHCCRKLTFKDAPEALKLFDEIEEERDRHLVGSK